MNIERIDKSGYKDFENVIKTVYKNNRFYRGTEGSIEKMLLLGKSSFKSHSKIHMYLLRDGNDIVGRFVLIHDFRLPDYVQVAFFEAIDGLGDVFLHIKNEAKKLFPDCSKIVVGLNAHLNYGAGILLNTFDQVPLFGLPYNHSYYHDYFKDLYQRKMFTFRFPMDAYFKWMNAYEYDRKIEGLTIRFMNKKDIKSESAIYTELNNKAFIKHPYWANRDEEEDQELFSPFRFLLDNEHLVIAEVNGKPVGFYLWYPDFNQLVNNHRDLNAIDVLKFRLNNKIDTFRFTEIGILPEYQKTSIALLMINKTAPKVYKDNYTYCEGGFIFEENKASIGLVTGLLKRVFGKNPEPYRQFAVYDGNL